MKNVLILCDYFPPHSGPRMGYLVKYLSRLGWKCYVVAGELPSRGGFDALTGFAEEVHIIPQKPHRKWNLLHILPMFWPYDYLRGEYDMLSAARKICKEQKIDIVLSSCTFGMFPNNAATTVAHENRLPVVIDLRDLSAQEPRFPFYKLSMQSKIDHTREALSYISRKRFERGLQQADALISVSPWHVQWLKDRMNFNTYLIYNGFDPESFFEREPTRSERFEIVYTGTLGSLPGRDYTFLLEAVDRLNRHGVITPAEFVVKFYCGRVSDHRIHDAIVEKGITDYFEFLPFVPAKNVPEILARASILLVLTNKNGYHGIMTTKFFEYLAMRRPILCVTSDEESLEQAIKEAHAGCAARTADEATQFIEKLFREWKQFGHVTGTNDPDKLEIYSRETQARQFARVFESVILNKKK